MAGSLRNSVLSLPPYHLISWGSLLGMELYQVSPAEPCTQVPHTQSLQFTDA
jgi:hypothetical protein